MKTRKTFPWFLAAAFATTLLSFNAGCVGGGGAVGVGYEDDPIYYGPDYGSDPWFYGGHYVEGRRWRERDYDDHHHDHDHDRRDQRDWRAPRYHGDREHPAPHLPDRPRPTQRGPRLPAPPRPALPRPPAPPQPHTHSQPRNNR